VIEVPLFALPLGDHARLRPLEPWQAHEFLAHIHRARPYMDPWIPWATLCTDLPSATDILQRFASHQATDRRRIYGIWLHDTLVGGVVFTKFDIASGACEIGCWLEEKGARRGLETGACRALIDWAISERGMSRVEWMIASGNTRSTAVARRLGMTRDDVPRQGAHRGRRHDSEIWSILSEEWRPPPEDRPSDAKAELDQLMRAFLGAFTNTGGTRPNVDSVREVFIPQVMIISNVGGERAVYDLDAFIGPRKRILTDGTLTEFSEWEVAERTEIFGSIAHRFSEYRKSGFLNGVPFEGSGCKTTQFLRTPAGWRMSSMAWDDV
jgi:ribosomal-protein-serine acetyltransferase